MKKHHITFLLAILFLTGLIVLWWADPTGIDPDASDAILPGLARAPVADIRRLEIVAAEKANDEANARKIVLERGDEGRWQMLEPVDAAADPSLVETLARNLKDMRRSADAGTIHDPPATFGLEPPSTIVRVFGADPKAPLATLEVGKTLREMLYVRQQGKEGIDVIDPRMLSMLNLPPVDWRDKSLFHLPSFRVGTLGVAGTDRDLKAVRDEGHWHLVRPFHALADDDKVEGMVAELSSLRVAKGNKGFVADDVKEGERAKYGLDQPTMTVEMVPAIRPGKTQTLVVGKPADDNPELNYARVGDQDDVVLIDAKNFRDLGRDPNALRSHKVAELVPERIEFVRVEAFGRTFDLSRTAKGWEQIRPTREPADAMSVKRLLNALGQAEASEFLDPNKVSQAGIDPPRMTIRVWQASPIAKVALGLDSPPRDDPRLVLEIGNHDPLRKIVYGRLGGDRSLLALGESLVEALPQSLLAFRDRTVLTLSPTRIVRLKISREGTSFELEAPVKSGTSTHWRMIAPVNAPADEESITKLVTLLANLTADAYLTDQIGDGKAFGLNAPTLIATWTTPAGGPEAAQNAPKTETGTIRIGKKVPKSDLWYANIEGSPIVFTLDTRAVDLFEAEFHSHRVLAFPTEAVRRVLFRWSDRSLALKPRASPTAKGVMWVPEGVAETRGFDLSRVGPLVAQLANLHTPKFLQYRGPIPASTGLDPPRLTIEVQTADDKPALVLRLGHSNNEQTYATTAAPGKPGAVFLVIGPAWHDLIQAAPRSDDLPENDSAPRKGTDSDQGAKPTPP